MLKTAKRIGVKGRNDALIIGMKKDPPVLVELSAVFCVVADPKSMVIEMVNSAIDV